MARLTDIRLRRSAVSGNIPTTTQLNLGELALNTADGKVYMKRDNGTESIVPVGSIQDTLTANSIVTQQLHVDSTGAIELPTGDTSERPTAEAGMFRFNTDTSQFEGYNGTEWGAIAGSGGSSQSAVWKSYAYTAADGQTAFTGSDDNNDTLSYIPGLVQVFLNGILLDPAVDYTANTGTNIVLTTAVSLDDLLQVETFVKVLGTADTVIDTATGDGLTAEYTLTADPGSKENVQVYVDGVYQETDSYTLTGTTLTFSENVPNGSDVEFVIGSRNLIATDVDNFTIDGVVTATSLQIIGASKVFQNNISDLEDVDITSASNGDALLYNSTSGAWENSPISLTDFGDITVTGLHVNSTGAIEMPTGTELERPTAVAGMLRFNTDSEQFEGYDGTEWGTIAGGAAVNPFSTDLFTATADQDTFTLSTRPSSEDELIVFVEGIYQNKNSYILTGDSLLLDEGLPVGTEVVVHIVGRGIVGTQTNLLAFTGNGVDTDFTLSFDPRHENNVNVYFDGVYQHKTEFTVSGTTLSFSEAPENGADIEVVIPTFTEINEPADNTVTAAKLHSELSPVFKEENSFNTFSQVVLATLDSSVYRSAKFQVQITDTVANEYHMVEVSCIHDDTTVYISEYGTIFTGSAALGTFDADIVTGNLVLQFTPANSNAMESKVIYTPAEV